VRRAVWNCLPISLLCCLLALSCQPTGVQSESVQIRLISSEANRPLLDQLTSDYIAHHPRVTFQIEDTISEASLNSLRTGRCDIVLSAWLPSEAELNPNRSTQTPLRAHVFGSDGLVLIVNRRNPVDNLSVAQLRAIFSGRTADWREVGGRVGDILVVSREDGSDDRKTFEALVMDKQPVTLGAVVMPSSADVRQYIASHPNAVGYASLASLIAEVKAVAVDGVYPNYEAILDGAYPLWRHLALLTRDPAEPYVQDFLSFVLGEPGQSIVSAYYSSLHP